MRVESIEVYELRRHASRWLARVSRGESFEVTDRGRPVARLMPAPRESWDRLESAGQITPPESDLDIVDDDIVPIKADFSASARLQTMRETER